MAPIALSSVSAKRIGQALGSGWMHEMRDVLMSFHYGLHSIFFLFVAAATNAGQAKQEVVLWRIPNNPYLFLAMAI